MHMLVLSLASTVTQYMISYTIKWLSFQDLKLLVESVPKRIGMVRACSNHEVRVFWCCLGTLALLSTPLLPPHGKCCLCWYPACSSSMTCQVGLPVLACLSVFSRLWQGGNVPPRFCSGWFIFLAGSLGATFRETLKLPSSLSCLDG